MQYSSLTIHSWLVEACQKNYSEVMKVLLRDSRIDPSSENNMAIRIAYSHKHLEVAKLLNDKVNLSNLPEIQSILLREYVSRIFNY